MAQYRDQPVDSLGISMRGLCQDKIIAQAVRRNGDDQHTSLADHWSFKDHGKSGIRFITVIMNRGSAGTHESFGTNWHGKKCKLRSGGIN